MNSLYVGLKKQVLLPNRRFLLIDDEVPPNLRCRVFDPTIHSFNPLGTTYREKCDFIAVLQTLFPGGTNTLTKEGVPEAVFEELEKARRLEELFTEKSKDPSYISAQRMVRRILRSPILKSVFCNKPNFALGPKSTVVGRINRAEIGEFDSLALGLFLMARYKGQVVIKDGGFYLCEAHISLIRERRLMCGVNALSELPPKLRQALLLEEKEGRGATYDDAVTLALYKGYARDTNEFNDYQKSAME